MGMTTNDAAEYLGVSAGHIAWLCKTGKIEAKKHGPLWDLASSSVEAYKYIPGRKKRITERIADRKPQLRPQDINALQVISEIAIIGLLNEIESCLDSQEPYIVLQAAPLIRSLLIDDPPKLQMLVDNYENDIRINLGRTIPVSSDQDFSSAHHQLIQDSIDPGSSPVQNSFTSVSVPEFLASIVLIYSGRRYSVKDVIMLEARIVKAEQSGDKLSREKMVKNVSDQVSPGGITPTLRQLKAIGSVILRALDSFRDEIPLFDSELTDFVAYKAQT